jgi:carbamoyltransferase
MRYHRRPIHDEREKGVLILGITDGVSCGAALAEDGRLLAAVNEEALSRLKMAEGFPRGSIAEVMRIAGVAPRDIDLVCAAAVNAYWTDDVRPFGGWLEGDDKAIRNSVQAVAGRLGPLIDTVPGLEALYYKTRTPIFAQRRRAIRRILAKELGIAAEVEFIDHHLAHATSAYFTSGFDDALVVTMDGGGDGCSATVHDVRGGQFERLSTISAFNSLGNYYAYVTRICGFKAQKHEGKITGLAAYGEPRFLDLLDSFITLEDGQLKNVGHVVFRGAVRALSERLPADWSREDLAASIQRHSERLATGYVGHHLRPDRPRNVALAGGLFANVRINQKVKELPGVDRVFVHPGMTDAGLAVGAALARCMRDRANPAPWPREPLPSVYLGAQFSAAEIERELDAHDLRYTRPDDIATAIAQLLAEGHVVARFDGRMEYGPRALGNRSILYQPSDRSVNDWLNSALRRTEFMPFAPATLDEYAESSYREIEGGRETARFMTITFDCNESMRRTCAGTVHVDGTARPQLVRPTDNPGFHAIIEAFRRLTGVPSVINTSFNMHEEPIVYSPADAIRAFRLGHLDYLAIGDFLVRSPSPITRRLEPMTALRRPAHVDD